MQGNITLGATATTLADIDGLLQIPGGPGTYSKIVVTGAGNIFTANGTLMPVLRGMPGATNTYVPAIGAMFPIITAQNGAGIMGQFVSLNQPTTGLAANTRFDVVYGPTAITLNVTPLTFQNLAANRNLNTNQQALAAALDVIRPVAGVAPRSIEAPLFDDLYDEDSDSDDNAFASLSGQGQTANPGAILATFASFSDAIADHQTTALLGDSDVQAALTPRIAFNAASGLTVASDSAIPLLGTTRTTPATWSGWGQGFGQWSRIGNADGLPGAHSSGGGFGLGADRVLAPDLRGGAALGFTRTTTSSAGTQATSDNYAGALYATWTPGAFVVNGRIAGGPTTSDSKRTIAFDEQSTNATGSISGWAHSPPAKPVIAAVAGIMVEPYAGITAQFLDQAAFTESSDFGLSFPAQSFTKLTTAIGERMATRFTIAGGPRPRPLRLDA